MNPNPLSHINSKGQAAMVDVSDKATTSRTATATGLVYLGQQIMKEITGDELQSKKGPVFQTAIIAGTMAVKKTSELIPLCHPLMIEKCSIEIQVVDQEHIGIKCTVGISHKTGVEMEALTGVSITALTIYDMCKAMSLDIVIKEIKLLSKTGGKREFQR